MRSRAIDVSLLPVGSHHNPDAREMHIESREYLFASQEIQQGHRLQLLKPSETDTAEHLLHEH